MPVLEYKCGMIMSVAAAKPRVSCLRCGGASLHELFTTSRSTGDVTAAAPRPPNLGSYSALIALSVDLLPMMECAQLT